MSDGAGEGSSCGPQGEEPGALSRLLDELARAPPADPERAWGKALRPGDILDRFEILRELGRGGFGAVYEALDRELGRKVALKTLRPGRSRDEWADEQLRKEAQAAASLSHPGIVTLHEACTCDRGPYLVMELLRGETLESRLARGPLPEAEAVEVGLQMARALAHVHGHGLVHRDLKPGNVFLGEDGRVKLLDLGLAHLLGRKSSTGGTPAYVAPEQWRGEEVDGRADVFALGAVLFEMVSGRRAFEVKEERSAALDPGPAPALGGKAPRGLARLVARCLAKEPSGRPTAAQAAEELLAIQRGLARPRAVRRVGILIGAGVAVGIAVALVALQAGRKGGGTSPDGRVVVAVADVVNETGERELDVLSGLLVTSLEQSRRLSVMTQARVLDLAIRAGRKDAARVDERIGREVGAAHGVRALLLPAIRKLGGTYSLEMRAVDPTRDEHLFTLADRATSKEGLLDLLDRLSERTRAELGEGQAEIARNGVRLVESATRSLEAYQHYKAGLEAWLRDGRRAVALRELAEAIRLDPAFAAAHSDLAFLYHAYGRPDLAAPHWRSADESAHRMPEKEQAVLNLRRSFATPSAEGWSREDALRLAGEIVKRFPDDKHVLVEAADAYEAFKMDELRDSALRRALELDPGFFVAARQLSARLGDRTDEALEIARRSVLTRRSAANLTLLAESLHATGAAEEAAATAREALRLDGGRNSLVVGRSCFVLRQGPSAPECAVVWDRMAKDGENPLERDVAAAALVEDLFVRGRVREGFRAMQSLDEDRRGDPMRLAYMLVIGRSRLHAPLALEQARRIPYPYVRRNFLSWLGAHAEAERVDRSIQERSFGSWEDAYQATRAAGERRFADAVNLIQQVQTRARKRNYPGWLFSQSSFAAEMLLAAGRVEEAAEVWPETPPCRCRDPVDHAANYPTLALVRARAMEQLGRRADAIRELDGVLAFWKEADPDLPLLAEAKAMRRRLAAASPAAGTPALTKVEAPTPSIAVLPFADMSPGKDQEYFADGVAEEILNALTHVRGLKVAGRTSSFSFKGKSVDLRTIGRRLGVAAVLEGSVRRDGDRIRVTAQLVKAEDGFHLWSERYDRELTGVFAVQDEIARAVVAKVAPLVAGGPEGEPRAAAPTSPEAYARYLEGRRLMRTTLSSDGPRAAVRAFEAALARDPGYAPAWVGLSEALVYQGYIGEDACAAQPATPSTLTRALEAAERAVALSPDSSGAYTARATARQLLWEWRAARDDAERAVALDPGSAEAQHRLGAIRTQIGDPAGGLASVSRAAEIDPLWAHAWSSLGWVRGRQGHPDLARQALLRALEIDPMHHLALANLAGLELAAGRPAEAERWAAKLTGPARLLFAVLVAHALGREGASREALEALTRACGMTSPALVALAHHDRGEIEPALEWLERAVDVHDPFMVDLRFLFARIQPDPRWEALLRKMNLPVD